MKSEPSMSSEALSIACTRPRGSSWIWYRIRTPWKSIPNALMIASAR